MLEKDVDAPETAPGGTDGEETKPAVRPNYILWSDELAKILKKGNVQVVLLSACETSKRDSNQFRWSGVAPALLKAGIPVVIGMQYVISDATAIHFSKNFYKALASGLSLDEAVAFGRRAIMELREDERDQDWGVPVLYTRHSGGDLFPRLEVNPSVRAQLEEELHKGYTYEPEEPEKT